MFPNPTRPRTWESSGSVLNTCRSHLPDRTCSVRLDHVPVEGEDERHCLVGHLFGAHARRVRENDAVVVACFDVDPVESVGVQGQHLAAFGGVEYGRRAPTGAGHDGVGVLHHLHRFALALRIGLDELDVEVRHLRPFRFDRSVLGPQNYYLVPGHAYFSSLARVCPEICPIRQSALSRRSGLDPESRGGGHGSTALTRFPHGQSTQKTTALARRRDTFSRLDELNVGLGLNRYS